MAKKPRKPLSPSKGGTTESRKWKRVSSSFIKEVKHEKGRLEVNINGKTYEYADKSGAKYKKITKANSKGRSFNKNVKTKGHRFRKGKRK